MHRFLRFVAIVVSLVCAVACSNKELQEIQEQIRQHEAELQRLMALVEEANSEVAALRATVEQVQADGYVTAVVPDERDGSVAGYNLSFSSGQTVYISTKEKSTPRISAKAYEGSGYYWTLNDEWLFDENGAMCAVKDGAAAPLLKVEGEEWYVSLDNGLNWTLADKAAEAGSSFKSIDTSNPNYVLITLSDGTVLQLTTWSAHVALRNIVNQLNNNLSATRSIVEAIDQRDYLLNVTPIVDNGRQVGWQFEFAKSGVVSLSNNIGDGQMAKIENGYWWVSNGVGEPFVKIDEVDNTKGEVYITDVDASESVYVRLTMSDGSTLNVPRYRNAAISFASFEEEIYIGLEETITLPFSITGTTPYAAVVSAFSDGNFVTSVSRTSLERGSISIKCVRKFDQGAVTVLVIDRSGFSAMETIPLIYGGFDAFELATGAGGLIMPAEGGSRIVPIDNGTSAHWYPADWLSVDFLTGKWVNITVDPNPEREDRYRTIDFAGFGSVLVKQIGNPDVATNPDSGYHEVVFPSDGGESTIPVFWPADHIRATWFEWLDVSVDYDNRSGNVIPVTVSAGVWDGAEDRIGSVIMEDGDFKAQINILQLARQR
jgi:hypothetical protein